MNNLKQNYLLREKERSRKRAIIIAVPAIVIFLIILIIVLITRPGPTCFDGKKNGEEEGIDCGGPCLSCGVKYAAPLEVISSQLLPISALNSEIVVKFRNNNDQYGAKFGYQISLISWLGDKVGQISGNSFIPPKSTKYLVETKMNFKSSDISRLEPLFINTEWFKSDKTASDLFEIYDKKTRLLEATESGYLEVSGKLVNKTSHNFPSVNLFFVLYSKTGRLLHVAKTEISGFKASEIRPFAYSGFPYFPDFQELDLTRIEVFADALFE